MSFFDNPRLALRALKGAPLSVLIALAILNGQNTDENELAGMTGYSNRTTRNALQFLSDVGLVARSRRYSGWQLQPAVKQLPLPLLFLGEGDDVIEGDSGSGKIFPSRPQPTLLDAVDNSQGNGNIFPSPDENNDGSGKFFLSSEESPEVSGKFFRSDKASTTTSSKHTRTREGQVGDEDTTSGNGKIFLSATQQAVFTQLRTAGVGTSMAQALCQKDWITPDYVTAHLDKIKRDGEPLRYAIHRMREGDIAPICQCGQCKECRDRYIKNNGLDSVIKR